MRLFSTPRARPVDLDLISQAHSLVEGVCMENSKQFPLAKSKNNGSLSWF